MKHIQLNNQFSTLGSQFYSKSRPVPVETPTLIEFNDELASTMGLSVESFNSVDAAQLFSGNKVSAGADPLAMAYAGSQFGSFNPALGDGRAIFLGEVTNSEGEMFDLQLKGSGRTAYSRNGDGRSALGRFCVNTL